MLASSPKWAGRGYPVLRVTCELPDARLPSEDAGFGENVLRTQQAHTKYATNASFEVGWARRGCAMRLAPSTSLDFSRSNARGRSDLHSPNDAWTSQTHVSHGIRQDRRGTSAASPPFRSETASLASPRPVARGCHSSSTGLAGHIGAMLCITTRDLRDEARVPRAG